MRGATVRAAPTGVNGRYRFAGVTPGAYVLWAETEIGDHHYTWWTRIHVSPGDSLTRDLDNSVEVDAQVYCDQEVVAVARTLVAEDSARRAEQRAALKREEPARRRRFAQCVAKAFTTNDKIECFAPLRTHP